MFVQKLNFTVDIDKIRHELVNHIFKLGPPVIQGEEFVTPEYKGFGGWSVLSRTGSWKDGWEIGHIAHKQAKDILYPNGIPNYKAFKYLNFSHGFEHKNPTEACVGEIRTTLEKLDSLGFYPRRARVSVLQAGGASEYHRDAAEGVYMARIHIPVITNEQCIHYCEDEHIHMPADGSVYMMWVNKMHQIKNTSTEDRYHIIMDAYDTQGHTEQFKYTGDIKNLERTAQEFRKNLDAVTLSPSEIAFYDAVKAQYVTKK